MLTVTIVSIHIYKLPQSAFSPAFILVLSVHPTSFSKLGLLYMDSPWGYLLVTKESKLEALWSARRRLNLSLARISLGRNTCDRLRVFALLRTAC